MSTIDVRVAAKVCEAEGICSYELVRVDGAPLPPFEAGAHIDVHLGDGLVRQYSLCNAPHETRRYLIGVLRDPGSRGGSAAMHDAVHAGSVLTIGVPRNHFPLVDAPRTLLLAGGIGVTPMLAMAEALAAKGAAFEMHYCARSPERAAFRERIAASSFAEQVHFHYDSDAAQRLDLPALLAARPIPTSTSAGRPASSSTCWQRRANAAGRTRNCMSSTSPAPPSIPRATSLSKSSWPRAARRSRCRPDAR